MKKLLPASLLLALLLPISLTHASSFSSLVSQLLAELNSVSHQLAAIPATSGTPSDSDASAQYPTGQNPYVTGICTDSTGKQFTDVCGASAGWTNQARKYYLVGGACGQVNIDCTTLGMTCQTGKCVAGSLAPAAPSQPTIQPVITVQPPVAPATTPACSLSFSPSTLTAPGTTTLAWTSSNADALTGACTGPLPVSTGNHVLSNSGYPYHFTASQTGIETCTYTPAKGGVSGPACSARVSVNKVAMSAGSAQAPSNTDPDWSPVYTLSAGNQIDLDNISFYRLIDPSSCFDLYAKINGSAPVSLYNECYVLPFNTYTYQKSFEPNSPWNFTATANTRLQFLPVDTTNAPVSIPYVQGLPVSIPNGKFPLYFNNSLDRSNATARYFSVTFALASATTSATTTPAGVCGSANNVKSATRPATNLCSVGTPSVVGTSTAGWTWSCAGTNSTSSCQAPIVYVPPTFYAICSGTTTPNVLNSINWTGQAVLRNPDNTVYHLQTGDSLKFSWEKDPRHLTITGTSTIGTDTIVYPTTTSLSDTIKDSLTVTLHLGETDKDIEKKVACSADVEQCMNPAELGGENPNELGIANIRPVTDFDTIATALNNDQVVDIKEDSIADWIDPKTFTGRNNLYQLLGYFANKQNEGAGSCPSSGLVPSYSTFVSLKQKYWDNGDVIGANISYKGKDGTTHYHAILLSGLDLTVKKNTVSYKFSVEDPNDPVGISYMFCTGKNTTGSAPTCNYDVTLTGAQTVLFSGITTSLTDTLKAVKDSACASSKDGDLCKTGSPKEKLAFLADNVFDDSFDNFAVPMSNGVCAGWSQTILQTLYLTNFVGKEKVTKKTMCLSDNYPKEDNLYCTANQTLCRIDWGTKDDSAPDNFSFEICANKHSNSSDLTASYVYNILDYLFGVYQIDDCIGATHYFTGSVEGKSENYFYTSTPVN